MRKTKIVCTVGPATENEDILRELMKAGMDVARFNFSHCNYETDEKRFNTIRRISDELGLHVATMLDTKGPEIRLRKFENGSVFLDDGDEFILTTRDVVGTKEICSVSFDKLSKDVSVGTRILINDGLIEMVVESVDETDVRCKVVHGGEVKDNKGINVPGVKLSMPYISDADMNDLQFGAKLGFDFIAASFVRTGADVIYLRKFTQALGWNNVRIIAKIENSDGVENIDEILDAADGVMVARGDMGVEIPFEQIPAIQKELIHKAYNAGKQVITATQMLESMITNPRPTRAEITDVANAIYDGTSAIMLSGETAAGHYPIDAVKTMALIAETAEGNINYKRQFEIRSDRDEYSVHEVTEAISHATVTTAHDLNAAAIITVTKGGTTARRLSKFHPHCPIISLTPSEATARQMNMSWGLVPGIVNEQSDTDKLIDSAIAKSVEMGLIKRGDLVVVTAGVPLGVSGKTNMMRVETVK
ncbi:MAG: pyruvate kinase [Ruminococcus sp.]|nr:pyruvate kinase [Ruminococcus sp.]